MFMKYILALILASVPPTARTCRVKVAEPVAGPAPSGSVVLKVTLVSLHSASALCPNATGLMSVNTQERENTYRKVLFISAVLAY